MKKFRVSALIVAIALISFALSRRVLTAPTDTVTKEKHGETVAPSVTLSGENMKAFVITWNSFNKIKDLPSEKKNLEHYSILFNSDSQSIYVTFEPIPLPVAKNTQELKKQVESMSTGGDSPVGRWMSYTVSRRDFKIIERHQAM